MSKTSYNDNESQKQSSDHSGLLEESPVFYKYRSLQNFKSFVDIILNNRLYAAQYKDLNDPMEGQYYYRMGELDKKIRNKLTEDKNSLRVCALSRVNDNVLMWSHYADGLRGVAIGVRIVDAKNEYIIRPIEYDGFASIRRHDFNEQTAIEILCHKLTVWQYEEEVRVFVRYKRYIHVQIEEIITGRAMSNADYGMVKELVAKINPNIRLVRADTIL